MNLHKKKADVLILGAGIAGCAASRRLEEARADYLVVEKHVEPGGLTRSISIGDAHFDYTGHFLHLNRCKTPSALPFANQTDEDWIQVIRASAVYLNGIMIPAPFQYNLYYLTQEMREYSISGFRRRSGRQDVKNLKEYLLAGFGEGMCNCFLFPYNEKLMARPLEELSAKAIKRFFPIPDTEKIEMGYSKEGANLSTGYNNSFWYPKKEGIGCLARGLAEGIKSIQTNCCVEFIDIKDKRVVTNLGEIGYGSLISSIPLKALCKLIDNPDLQRLGEVLRHSRVFCLNLLLDRPVPEPLNGLHWIYLPDKRISFYRLGVYSNISPYMNPKGTTAYYIEVARSDKEEIPPSNSLINEIFLSLKELGWGISRECNVISSNWIDFAYVHFDLLRDAAVKEIFAILRSNNIYPIGRYGLWDYISMEDSIFSGIEAANEVCSHLC